MVTQQQLRPYDDEDGWIFNKITGMFHHAQNARPHHGHDGRQGQPGRGPPLGQWNMDKELGDIGRKKNPPPGNVEGHRKTVPPNKLKRRSRTPAPAPARPHQSALRLK